MTTQESGSIPGLIKRAVEKRKLLIDPDHHSAIKLFNGFLEGEPQITADLYGSTLLLFTQSVAAGEEDLVVLAQKVIMKEFPWVRCVVVKNRGSQISVQKQGVVVYGSQPDKEIVEHGVRYTIDLQINQDASFYIDTRNLRRWLIMHSAGKKVLNTFAYTGTLGIAALAGGAGEVWQVDLNRKFLGLAVQSAGINSISRKKMHLLPVDFFMAVGQMKREKQLFDIVILDPPFFSVTGQGTVDLVNESTRLVNKVRPLVRDGGKLVVVNNALYLSGRDFYNSLEMLTADGYLKIDELIEVPDDVAGYPDTKVGNPPADPAPFNHSTKIAVLGVKKKPQ